MPDASRFLRRVRWTQVLVYSGIGLALVGTAVQSWLGVERVRAEVAAAQGRRISFSLDRDLDRRRPATPEALERELRSYEDQGLRCIAVMDRGGPPVSAGDCRLSPAALRELLEARPGTVTDVDGFVALVAGPPPPPPGRHRPPPPPHPHEPGGPAGPGPWMPPPPGPGGHPEPPGAMPRPRRPEPGGPERHGRMLIVYEPLEANALRQSAARSLAVALITALALIVATVVLWRLARRAERLQAEAERDRRLVTLGEMSAVLAHEIRNPLAALKGHAQLLVERLGQPGPAREKAERLVTEARRLERLVEDLLSFVRATQVAPAPVDPAALLRDAAEAVAPDRIDVDASAAPPTWQLDGPRLQQVLANLLRNAVEASPDGARVIATADMEDERLAFRIRDHGPGLPPDPERLFEPFHTTRAQGTGLGLAVARRVAELHGGRVTARTHPDGGAEFRVVIP